MPITLRLWQRGGKPPRIYVNDYVGKAKVWLWRGDDGSVRVSADADAGQIDDQLLFDTLGKSFNLDPTSWDALTDAAARGATAATVPGRALTPQGRKWSVMDSTVLAFADAVDPIPKVTRILVDRRQDDAFLDALSKVRNLGVDRDDLALGDVSAGGDLVILRRTPAQLDARDPDDAAIRALRAFVDAGGVAVVALEGDPYATGQVDVADLTGRMAKLASWGRVSIVPTIGPAQTAHLVGRLVRQVLHGRGAPRPSPIAPAANLVAVHMLMAVDGVGDKLARSLLTRFGSVAGVAAAGDDDLASVHGMDADRLAALRAALCG